MEAPRLLSRLCDGLSRGAWLAACVCLVLLGTLAQAQDPDKARGRGGQGIAPGCVTTDLPPFAEVVEGASGPVTSAFYFGPTRDYAHGVLGDAIEAEAFLVAYDGPLGRFCDHVYAGRQRVFEDTNPRLVDVTGDGVAEVIVTAAHANQGARVEIYGYPAPGEDIRLLAHTPYIGMRNRWRAVVGMADLDGDGLMELAEIDRPHLAKTLRIWRLTSSGLELVASMPGVTNHRIGEPFITGGLRDCGDGPEIVTADAGWSRVVITRFRDGQLEAVSGARFSPSAIEDALICR